MPIHFRCDQCQSALAISRRKAEQEISCPKCNASQTVPAHSDGTLATRYSKSSAVPVAKPYLPKRKSFIALLPAALPLVARPRAWAVLASAAAVLLICGIVSVTWLAGGRAAETVAVSEPAPAPVPALPNKKEPPLLADAAFKALLPPERVVMANDGATAKLKWHKQAYRCVSDPSGDAGATKAGPPANEAGQAKALLTHGKKVFVLADFGDRLSEEELRRHLGRAPEISLKIDLQTRKQIIQWTRDNESKVNAEATGPMIPKAQQQILHGLPLSKGPECRLDHGEATRLFQAVSEIRTSMSGLVDDTFLNTFGVERVREKLGDREMNDADFRACMQMLQVEDHPFREYLIAQLRKTTGAHASKALAQRAVVDLSPEIRALAVQALKERPVEEFQEILVNYLNYPWSAAAEHAAEALVELRAESAVPDVIRLLEEPDVTMPRPVLVDGDVVEAVPQLVRINHLRNCLLCHPPTLARGGITRRQSLVGGRTPIGAIPMPGQSLPPPTSTQYYHSGDLFVRADITYLRQDFSVMQPVYNPGAWPEQQRFDFVVRMLPLTETQAQIARMRYPHDGPSRQRQAQLYVLRQLTGLDLGNSHDGWRPLVTASAR